eukprot:gene18680-biopygen20468
MPPWEKRPRPRPVRVRFFKFYRVPRVRTPVYGAPLSNTEQYGVFGKIRSNPEWPGVARSGPEWPRVTRSGPEWPGVAQSDPEWPGAARSGKE